MADIKKEEIKWKKCPGCNRSIPDFWTYDERCGWNVTKEVEQKLIENEVEIRNKQAMDFFQQKFEQRADLLLLCRDFVLKNFELKDFPDHRTSLVNSLFISLQDREK